MILILKKCEKFVFCLLTNESTYQVCIDENPVDLLLEDRFDKECVSTGLNGPYQILLVLVGREEAYVGGVFLTRIG